jgi:hypothetical protein
MAPLVLFAAILLAFHTSEFALAAAYHRDTLSRKSERCVQKQGRHKEAGCTCDGPNPFPPEHRKQASS